MNQINEQLKKLGLGEYESAIYEVLLLSSPASATFIARKCSLSRSSVYTTLSSLISKGLVGTTYKNDVKQFIAEDYSAVEQLLQGEKKKVEEKFKVLESLEKNLKSLVNQQINIPQIIFFEGQDGLKKIYLSMMREAPIDATLYLLRDEFVWQSDWKFIFEQEWHDRVKRIKIEKNIHTKLLTNDSSIERSHVKTYKGKKATEQRFLPRKNSLEKFALYTIGDTVIILSMEKNNLVGIKITNLHIAQNFQKIFDSLWQQSKKL